MSITVYSKPSCVQCNATYRALDSQGSDYEVIDITESPDAYEYVLSLGYKQAPVVVVRDWTSDKSYDLHHWSGFRPDLIERIADYNEQEQR